MLDYLRKLPLFAGLSETELLDVLRATKVVRFRAGEMVCRAGEPGSAMFLIESGTVAVSVPRTTRGSVEVKQLGPGELFGELALVDSQPRSADVEARTDVVAYSLDRAEFDKLRAQMNPAAYKVLRQVALIVSERLKHLNEFATGGIETAPRVDPGEAGKRAASPGWRDWLTRLKGART